MATQREECITRLVGLMRSPFLDRGGRCVRAALARPLGVSRARVTQVLRRLLPGRAPVEAKTAQSPRDGGELGGRP